ncbi:MAG: fused MFS/spermidine synthase [Elusimicrobiota bacterium]|nr:fused MFS/spermidine synthase [Elusimicrobiota bacterium]
MILFSLTVFFSALLLFLVQPVIAKVLLPWFGGGASVWAVCLVFFQTALFLGYLYAHLLVRRLRPAQQAQVHSGLIGASLLALFFLNRRWAFYDTGDPAFRILGLLVLMVGLPYFTLSATGPLLQAWLALRGRSGTDGKEGTGAGISPYRLYALSNAGSLLSLLGYPFLVEPYLTLRQQLSCWTACYVGFGVLCAMVAARVKALPQPALPAAAPGPQEKAEEPSYRRKLLWLALAACPSVLLLSITNHLTQNVAAIPFLWLLPLSLYLLSFIFCFGPGEWRWSKSFLPLPALTLTAMAVALTAVSADPELKLLVPLFSAGLFVACLMCHGELARLKPHPQHLTTFYLMISLGGAAGSVFVGLVAPHLFSGYYELQFGIGAYALLAWSVFYRDEPVRAAPAWLTLGALALALIFWMGRDIRQSGEGRLLAARNFYGALSVTQEILEDGEISRSLSNGTIVHGSQFLTSRRRGQATTYYGLETGIGLTMRQDQRPGPRRVGVIGLGAGTMAAYGQPGDYYRFYEINPLVVNVARSQFSFLGDSQAGVDIALGDARLLLQREESQNLDVLVVDAFSGDAIPVHLLTREAFALYFRHLKPDGVLAVHVSSLYLSLAPVVKLAATAFGKRAGVVINDNDPENGIFGATWVLVTRRPGFFESPLLRRRAMVIKPPAGVKLWTDDFSNLYRVLRWGEDTEAF